MELCKSKQLKTYHKGRYLIFLNYSSQSRLNCGKGTSSNIDLTLVSLKNRTKNLEEIQWWICDKPDLIIYKKVTARNT